MTYSIHWHADATTINRNDWNQPLTEPYYYHRIEFLETIAQANIQDCRLSYCTVYEHDALVGSAVVSYFQIDILLFINSEKTVRLIKKVVPNLGKIKLLFCGTPISIGQPNLWWKDARVLPVLIEEIDKKMKQIARAEKIKFLAFKEFSAAMTDQLEPHLIAKGFFKGHSLPTINLLLPFRSFAEYLQSLSANKRRQLKQSLRKLNRNPQQTGAQTTDDASIDVLNASEVDAQWFYTQYLAVMSRATVKFEMLNEAFFRDLFASHPQVQLLCLKQKGIPKAGFVFLEQEHSLTFLWAGRTDRTDTCDSYFNLMTALVKLALEKQKTVLYLGQTAYYTKMRMGGRPEPLYLFFKSTNKVWHWLFNVLRNQIFPPTPLPFTPKANHPLKGGFGVKKDTILHHSSSSEL